VFRNGCDDAHIGLVGYHPVDIVYGEVVAAHDFLTGACHTFYSMNKHFFAILPGIVQPVCDSFNGCRIEGATPFHIQLFATGAIATQNKILDSITFLVLLQQYGTSAIPENHTGVSVGVVYD